MTRGAGSLLGLALFWLGDGALASPPQPPDQIAHSGVLVDAGGVPLAGPVDLTARIYDAASAGTLVFKQSFTGVALSDGYFTVNLGPTGAATDSPTNPLTTSLRTALTGDLAAGSGRYVEITVNTDPPLARVQLVLVPYALRADHASTADVATNALDSEALGGVDSVVLAELFEHYTDGFAPPSTDPSEGTADPDGDGEANFVDPDNDDDTLNDGTELGLGTDINLVTPRITGVSPNNGDGNVVTQVTVTGTGFQSGLSALFGTQSVSVSNVTATSFQAGVGPKEGPYPVPVALTVTNPNAESHTLAGAFVFGPPGGIATLPLPFTLAGPSLPVGIVAQGDELLVFGTQASAQNKYAVDTLVDGNISFNRVLNLNNSIVPSVISWNASRVLHALRGQGGTVDQIQLLRDSNNDQFLDQTILIESPGDNPKTNSPALAFDGSGRPGGGYLRVLGSTTTAAVAFHDRDGNGAFTGPNELVTIEPASTSTAHLGDAAFDASGRLAYVYNTGGNVRVAYDRSGDGDFDDSPAGVAELSTVASTTPPCLGMTFDGAGRLAILWLDGGNPQLRYDRNGDADFLDANESLSLPGSATSTGCDVGTSAATGRIVIVHNPANELRVLVDMNDDGDFLDGVEDAALGAPVTAPLRVTTAASGAVRVLAPQGVVTGFVR